MFSKFKAFLSRIFKRNQSEFKDKLSNKQYEKIGRIIVHGALTDRQFNRSISRLPLYGQLLTIIGAHPEQRKARMIVSTFFKKLIKR